MGFSTQCGNSLRMKTTLFEKKKWWSLCNKMWVLPFFLYLSFLHFAEAPAGNALPAKILFRNYIFGRGAIWKCPASEILTSAAAAAAFWILLAANISLIPEFKFGRGSGRVLSFIFWFLLATNISLIPESKIQIRPHRRPKFYFEFC